MKARPRRPEQHDLLRPRLTAMIYMRHEIVKLAALIDWDFFEREWAGFFPSDRGRPATPSRLLYLQHAFRLSDDAVVARWVENPYYQHLTGETFFQHRPPWTHSCSRAGATGSARRASSACSPSKASCAVEEKSLERVAVDTTVMEKAIAHPTDARLFERARSTLVTLELAAEVPLQQSYARLVPRLAAQAGRYTHAKQFKRMRKALRRLKGYLGRVRGATPSRIWSAFPRALCASACSGPWR